MDKWATKLVAEAVGIHTAPGRLAAAEIADIEFETDVVVKPASAGSSFGVALARDAAQLRDALRCAARLDDRILIEDVVPGREIDVAVLREADGRRWASPPLEIHTNGLFDTQSKYDGSARFSVPADIDSADRAALTGAALGCSTRSAAPVSPASTSSSPTTDRPQRGQHHAGNDGRVPGTENVRRSRTALRAAGRAPGRRCHRARTHEPGN
jgi:hypothetical protein